MTSTQRSRVQAGVREGGQFSVSTKDEPDLSLAAAATAAAAAAPELPDGQAVAIRNTLSDHPKWLHGTVTRDAPLGQGKVGVLIGEGETTNTYVVDASSVVPFVEPAEYDGDDADTMAEAFGWSGDDWGYYYDGRAEREQTGAYRNGFEDAKASTTELEHPAGVGRVQTWVSDMDSVPVFQIDTDGETRGRIRVNLNDAPIYDGDPETDEKAEAQVRAILADYRPFEPYDTDAEDSLELQRRDRAYDAHLESAAAKLDAIWAALNR